jgi:transcriptional regulator with XRE-family HTH domain
MPKTIHRTEYQVLLDLLREQREAAGKTQTDCSEALGRSQSFISDVERGTRLLDLIQLRDICLFLGISLETFVKRFEAKVGKRSAP